MLERNLLSRRSPRRKVPHQVPVLYGTLYIIKNPTRPMIDDSNCHGDKALTIKPMSVLSKIIPRINYLSLARSRIDLSFRIPPHIFTNRYIKYQPDQMIDHSSCHGRKAPTMKPTSVLPKIISRINYLSLARSRIDSSIGIPPHIFTNRYNKK